MLKLAIWLSGIVDYRLAAEILERVGQVAMSDSSIWRQVQGWGARIAEANEGVRQSRAVIAESWEAVRRMKEPAGRMGAALDGGMIHIRQEGWKELKMGCIFDVERHPEPDLYREELVEVAHAEEISYVARLEGPEALGLALWKEAERRGWERAKETEVLGDGAPWIWNQVQAHFYTSEQVVDWYHGVEHLATAARLLHGEGTEAAQRWLKRHKLTLYQGHAGRIAQELEWEAERRSEAEALRREAGYFRRHRRRMNYLEMRERGWLIGSGPVEGGIKQFKARLAGPGMRWSRPGAEHILPVCEAVLSHRFDQVWAAAYNSPLN